MSHVTLAETGKLSSGRGQHPSNNFVLDSLRAAAAAAVVEFQRFFAPIKSE
jgi:hypothetical protein